MDIKASKIELVKMILNINNDTVIQKVLDFVTNEKSNFWNELTESEQVEIQKGIAQLNQGKRILYKDVHKNIS